MGAKGLSLFSQAVGAIWIMIWSAYRFVNNLPTVREAVLSGIFIAAVFSPVYFNLIMDKIVPRLGKKNTSENTN